MCTFYTLSHTIFEGGGGEGGGGGKDGEDEPYTAQRKKPNSAKRNRTRLDKSEKRRRGGTSQRWLGKSQRWLETDRTSPPYPLGLFPEGLSAVDDVDATGDGDDDATTGEVVDGIGLVGDGGIEIKEWEIRGLLFWSEDETDALGE